MNIQSHELYEALLETPLLDIHTHLDATHLGARGIHDVVLYHMVVSDLYSAGCPDGSRLSENPTDAEVEQRMLSALPYLPLIQNTSCFWGVRMILRDLYGWDRPIDAQNWRELDAIIRARAREPLWARKVLKRAGILGASTELWRRHDGAADDVLQYSLEWAFFARSQWGQFDTALVELENAWQQDNPGAPLPVNMKEGAPLLRKIVRSAHDVHMAIKHYCDKIPFGQIISTAQHLSADIRYRVVSDLEFEGALTRRAEAGPRERDIYANYVLDSFLCELERRGTDILFHFSFGAEPLPFETGSKLSSEAVFDLAGLLGRHPGIKFQALLSSASHNQALCTVAREIPNLSLAGYWWHNFFPSCIRQVIHERLDMLATCKQAGFFSDAYCVDWAYAKACIVRKQFAEVLAEKISQGQYSEREAMEIARDVLHNAAARFMRKPEIR